MKIGIIGCGNISKAYFEGAQHCDNLSIKACADIHMDAAQGRAEEYGCQALSVEDLLSDQEIELVVNLTIPKVHAQVGIQILNAGKHVYAEKPLATTVEDGRKLLDLAHSKGLRVGSAPDTFLFKGAQTSRKLIDDNWIGKPLSGLILMACHGHERWHPNPGFYYDVGGGPLFDMGPYYLTALVHFLGPVKSVMARCNRGFEERLATSEGAKGQRLPVRVDTHNAATLEMANGALITMMTSFDIWGEDSSQFRIHGTEGSLDVGDPNGFGMNPKIFRPQDQAAREIPFTHAENQRMIGVLDMVDAIEQNRPHRASGELAMHVLEVMEAFGRSSDTGKAIDIKTQVERAAPLPAGLPAWKVS
jgi:predicted dehydrogenase